MRQGDIEHAGELRIAALLERLDVVPELRPVLRPCRRVLRRIDTGEQHVAGVAAIIVPLAGALVGYRITRPIGGSVDGAMPLAARMDGGA